LVRKLPRTVSINDRRISNSHRVRVPFHWVPSAAADWVRVRRNPMRGTIDFHWPCARRRLYTSQKRSIEHFGPMLCSCFFAVLVLSPPRRTVLVLVIDSI